MQDLMLLILIFNCIEGCVMVVSDLNKKQRGKAQYTFQNIAGKMWILSLGL